MGRGWGRSSRNEGGKGMTKEAGKEEGANGLWTGDEKERQEDKREKKEREERGERRKKVRREKKK